LHETRNKYASLVSGILGIIIGIGSFYLWGMIVFSDFTSFSQALSYIPWWLYLAFGCFMAAEIVTAIMGLKSEYLGCAVWGIFLSSMPILIPLVLYIIARTSG
jgi:hypothetical protein